MKNKKSTIRKLLLYSFLIVFVSTLFNSCVSKDLTEREEETTTFAIDFREYADKGFLFMPDEYFGEYEVKGIIRAELRPKIRYIEGESPDMEGYTINTFFFGGRELKHSQLIHDINLEDLIEHIYDIAIEWGGDAFTHFETSIETDRTNDDPNTSYPYYTISGIVIERK